jgi:hypothetical protein
MNIVGKALNAVGKGLDSVCVVKRVARFNPGG